MYVIGSARTRYVFAYENGRAAVQITRSRHFSGEPGRDTGKSGFWQTVRRIAEWNVDAVGIPTVRDVRIRTLEKMNA